MIRFEDGLPEHLASTVALCTADLPFIVQLLNVMKRGNKFTKLALALYLYSGSQVTTASVAPV